MRGSLSLLDPIGEVSIVTGNPVRGAGWYGPNTGLHSVAIRVLNFQGRVSIQATLAASPGSNDWFSVLPSGVTYWQYPRPGVMITGPNTGETSNVGFNFSYNVIWVRAIVDQTYLVGIPSGSLSSVYFDSLHDVQDVDTGADGADDRTTIIAQSFYASGLGPITLTLTLSAAVPSDGGSLAVYLVADDGTGGTMGIAGNPTYSGSPNSFIAFTNAQLIGTIFDSALTTVPTSVSLDTTPVITTLNGEYWIAILWQNSSSAKWWYSGYAPGAIGLGNQRFANNYNQFGLHSNTLTPGVDSIGPYQMVVASNAAPAASGQYAFLGTVDCVLLNY